MSFSTPAEAATWKTQDSTTDTMDDWENNEKWHNEECNGLDNWINFPVRQITKLQNSALLKI